MKESRFWYLDGPESTAKCADCTEDVDWEWIKCPVHDGHQRAGKRIGELSVELPGGAVQDFVWTWLSECVVQDSVLELLRSHGLTGWEVRPVRARFKRSMDREPPRLWELVVTGWAGMASPKSGIHVVKRCDACGLVNYSAGNNPNPGSLIDMSQWDGSDIFMVWPLPRHIFVTGRLAQLLHDHRLTGARLRFLDEVNLTGNWHGGSFRGGCRKLALVS